jgi:ATP-dependent RNA helicase RhlE
MKQLRYKNNFVIGTPGRVKDLVDRKCIRLGDFRTLVLDEADRMLDMGFIKDIRKIIGLLPAKRQNLMFSATFADDVRELAATILHDPAQIQIARRNASVERSARSSTRWIATARELRGTSSGAGGSIARSCSRERSTRQPLAERKGHGRHRRDRHSRQQEPGPARSCARRLRMAPSILVATEVAGGLDIDALHVVNYELPTTPAAVHDRHPPEPVSKAMRSRSCIDEADLLADIEACSMPIPWEFVGLQPDRSIRAEPIREVRGGNRGRGPRVARAPRRGMMGRARRPRRPCRRGPAPLAGQRPAPAPHRSSSTEFRVGDSTNAVTRPKMPSDRPRPARSSSGS